MKLRVTSIMVSILASAGCLAESYTMTIPPGGSLIANQLDNGGNTLDEVLPNVPPDTMIFKGDCSGQVHLAAYFDDLDLVWVVVGSLASDGKLLPGEGAVIYNPGPSLPLTFTGTPHVPVLPPALACLCGEYNLLGRQTDDLGTFDNIMGVAPQDGAQVLRHNPGQPMTPLQAPNYSIYTFSSGTWSPGAPVLDIGEAAWFVMPCNSCITLQCASDAVVECGSTWDFTPPTVSGTCCGGSVTVTVISTLTSGSYPKINTRTWLATDACGHRTTCTQRVTVAETTPPVLTCGGDKTVQFGSAWVFDPPGVFNVGCGNLPVSVLSTVTSHPEPCTETLTRTWQATDCCGHMATCSQKVTVLGARTYAFTTLAGLAGNHGSADGTGSAARFYVPFGVAVDSAGNVYVAEDYNYTIRKISSAGVATTLAGSPGQYLPYGADGTGSAARFLHPLGVAVDGAGNVYVADHVNHTIRKVTPIGVVTTLAGSVGNPGYVDANGSGARFNYPVGVAVDVAGNVYVADSYNDAIRKVTPAGVVTTLAVGFYQILGVAVDSAGNVYTTQNGNNAIEKVTPAGVVTILAGGYQAGNADGTGSAARFDSPDGLTVDSAGNVYVADSNNNTIRKVTPAGVVTTLGGLAGYPGSTDGTGSAARFSSPVGMAVDSAGNLYVADTGNHTIRKGMPVECPSGLTCVGDKTVECGGPWTFDQPVLSGCCANAMLIDLGTVAGGTACSPTFTKTWQATDWCGNTFACSQKVTVLDTTSPVLLCPANLTVQCDADVPAPNPAMVTATDTCSSMPVVSHLSDVASGTCPKIIARTYQASDTCGNVGTGTQTITVHDTIAPVLSGCANLSAVAQSCQGGAMVNFAVTALDNCDGGVPVKYTPAPGFFPIGTTVVTCEALDHCGNRSTCSFNVSISPPAKPLGLCSFTQGFYGNAKGKFNATPSLTLVGNLLAQGPLVVGKLGSRSLSFLPSDAALLQQRLPAGGTAATLPNNGDQILQTAVLPLSSKGGFDNILLGQTVTLSLSVRLSPALLCIGIVPNFCTEGTLPGPDGLRGTTDDVLNLSDNLSFTIPNSVRTALADPGLGINDSSVQGLLELANRALAAQPTGAASLADINAAVDAINRGFDNCRVLIDCTTHAVLPDSYNDGFGNRPPPTSGSSHGRSLGVNIRTRASNLESTKEPFEPDHAGNAGGKSLWWQWQAPLSGPVTIQTDGSSFDTLLAVYLGSSLTNLTLVASNDDSHGLLASEVCFQAQAGADYQIAVDGFDGASGTIVLTILVEPTRLGLLVLLPNDWVQLGIDGSLGATYTIEASSDLLTWTPIASMENTSGTVQFADPGARNSSQRFYRVLLEL